MTLSAAWCAGGTGAAESTDLLIEAGDLAGRIPDERFVILDVRLPEQFHAGHLPSAVRIDHDEWNRLFTPHRAADRDKTAEWSERIGKLGIDETKTVVLYDGDTGIRAARIWFILNFWSVRDVRLLNGGFGGWQAVRGAVETEPIPPKPAKFQAVPRETIVVTKPQLCVAIPEKSVQILDVRSPAEFDGSRKLAKRGGHMPGAINVEWTAALDKSGKFKSVDQLKALFEAAGLKKDKPIVTHCQSGGRASHTLFALKLAGYDNIRNYYASWQEWGNDDEVPVE